MDGKSVARVWVKKLFYRRKLFMGGGEKGEDERCSIRKASVTDSCLILDTSASASTSAYTSTS